MLVDGIFLELGKVEVLNPLCVHLNCHLGICRLQIGSGEDPLAVPLLFLAAPHRAPSLTIAFRCGASQPRLICDYKSHSWLITQ